MPPLIDKPSDGQPELKGPGSLAVRSTRLEAIPPDALERMAACLVDSKTRNETIQRHLIVATTLAKARGGFVSLFDESRGVLAVAEVRGRASSEVIATVPGEGDIGRSFSMPAVVRGAGRLCVPVLHADHALGVLTLLGPRQDADDRVWGAIGRHLGAAIQVSELRDAATRRTRDLETAVAGLRALERDRDALLSNASHELKNPLTTIKAYLHMARRERLGPLSDRQRNAFDVCDRSADRLLRLINDMLLTSRLQSGEMELDQKPFGLKALAEEVLRPLVPMAEASRVQLAPIRGGEAFVKGDRERMGQTLAHLVENAIAFNQPGGQVRIRIHTDSGVAILQVQDTGVGIPAGELPLIFSRFFRGQGALERRTGSGLGLAISRQIVHLHGGRIGVDSEPGRGTSFTLRLPLFAGAVGQAQADGDQATALGDGILLVEDDDDCREVLQQLLEADGFGVRSARTLENALTELESSPPALVLLDLRLGGSDGRTLLRHLRARPRLKDIPVFVVSGDTDSAAGFSWDGPEHIDDFFEKPLNLPRLMDRIHGLLDRSGAS